MRHLWPVGGPGRELDRAALAVAYGYPATAAPGPGGSPEPFVRLNFVASVDGATSVEGVSGGLHAPGDDVVFGVLRQLADVVLVGAGTVRAEDYRGVRTGVEARTRRRARGQAEVPPVAVVTARAELDPSARLFTDTATPPLVLTTSRAPTARRRELAATGAEVVLVDRDGDGPTEDPAGAGTGPAALLAALRRRGLTRVLCEGGPALAGALAAADRVDEVCLSVAPQLVGGPADPLLGRTRLDPAPRDGPSPALRLAGVLAEGDGVLLRYRTARGDAAAGADPPSGGSAPSG